MDKDKAKVIWATFSAFMALVGLVSGFTIRDSMTEAERRAERAEIAALKTVIQSKTEGIESKLLRIEQDIHSINKQLDSIGWRSKAKYVPLAYEF